MSSFSRRLLVVVVGVSGRQGGSVIDALLEHPERWLLRGLTSDLKSTFVQELLERHVDVVHVDLNDREELVRLFRDAHGVFAVTNYSEAKEMGEHQQAIRMLDAAREARVKHVILSLFPDIDVPSTSNVEHDLRQRFPPGTSPSLTLVRVGYYYQNLLTFFSSERSTGTFRYPILEGKSIPFYDVRDTGQVISKLFEEPERWAHGPVVPIVAELLSMEEICGIIQAETSREIECVALPPQQAEQKFNWYILETLRWYSSLGSLDPRQVEKCREVSTQLRKFVDWIRETNRLFE